MNKTPRMLDDGTEVPDDDDEILETSRFAMLYSLRTDDDGRYAVVAFDRYGKRVSEHALQGLSFRSPGEAFDAIRRAESGSGEIGVVTAAAAVRSA